ncbi:MAG: M23 family metallopeptidase [Candidatus Margulisiibacteriota bacterium]|jgi:hypothetical protein
MIKKACLFGLTLTVFIVNSSFAEFSLERETPLAINKRTNANFGEFRSRTGTYKIHDGIDFKAKTGVNVYPVAAGTARIFPANTDAWGKYVVVEHPDGYRTRYAHLDSINVEANAAVTTSTVLGVSGSTEGGKISGMKPHLHFSLGITSVLPTDTVNPIFAGLKQSSYGVLSFVTDLVSERRIRLLGTGVDRTFDGENEIIDVPEPNKPVRAIVEAYLTENSLGSNPYQIEFEIEKFNDASWTKQTKTIVFDTMTNILNNFGEYYCFSRPYVTRQYTDPGYYFVKFYPTAGRYKITVKIYASYRDDFGFHLTTPSVTKGTIIERYITVGMNMVDYVDHEYSYAWLPDDIAGDKGVMLASTSFSHGGVAAAAVGDTGPPEIFYVFANNSIITNNLIDIDPNLQQKALIEARARGNVDWTIQVFNETGTAKIDEIQVKNQEWSNKNNRRV